MRRLSAVSPIIINYIVHMFLNPSCNQNDPNLMLRKINYIFLNRPSNDLPKDFGNGIEGIGPSSAQRVRQHHWSWTSRNWIISFKDAQWKKKKKHMKTNCFDMVFICFYILLYIWFLFWTTDHDDSIMWWRWQIQCLALNSTSQALKLWPTHNARMMTHRGTMLGVVPDGWLRCLGDANKDSDKKNNKRHVPWWSIYLQ